MYLFSLTNTLTFHQHNDIIAFSEATSCEKSIYYGIKDDHKQHFSKSETTCCLCSHHTITPQVLFNRTLVIFQFDWIEEYHNTYKSLFSLKISDTSSRGPPYSFVNMQFVA